MRSCEPERWEASGSPSTLSKDLGVVLLDKDNDSATIRFPAEPLSALLERRLTGACGSDDGGRSVCLNAALEHFAAGGRRVRALICFHAGRCLGLEESDASLAATVCELLHNASLIQDDLLDRTAIRRGASSVWARHGDTVAVCTGDLLLSAAYGLLAELSSTALIGEALQLVHRRTSEVIHGQAAECLRKDEQEDTIDLYEQQAIGKSASLLSLALELPLLLSGRAEFLPKALAAASYFAVAYQIVDDLKDYEQDAEEGSLNLLLLLQRLEGMSLEEARAQAVNLAAARLSAAEVHAGSLPNHCAATLLDYADRLRNSVMCGSSVAMTHRGV
jgi:geranylgeranyl diphosphate synthase type II